MDKPKNDPEKELFRRGIILSVCLGVVGGVLLANAVLMLVEITRMTILFVAVLSNLDPVQHPELLFVIGAICFVILLGYTVWNVERVDELKKIVESEENTDVLPE